MKIVLDLIHIASTVRLAEKLAVSILQIGVNDNVMDRLACAMGRNLYVAQVANADAFKKGTGVGASKNRLFLFKKKGGVKVVVVVMLVLVFVLVGEGIVVAVLRCLSYLLGMIPEGTSLFRYKNVVVSGYGSLNP